MTFPPRKKRAARRVEQPNSGLSHVRPLRRALLAWYDENALDLPWRGRRDPYRVWIAEVMLQQTRVAVVVPAYRRFVRELPSLSRLAQAGEERVLSLWSGLGYYSRARALHRAARALAAGGARTFPRDMETALSLPGVGPYTAAAVLSIAYGLPHAAVDGNVKRVLSRLYRVPRAGGGASLRARAEQLLHRRRPGDWNQAVMELGERICLPRAPRCLACPVRRFCEAHAHGEVERYPPPRTRRAVQRVELRLTVVRDRRGRLLLERGAFPFLPHLWLPPVGESGNRTGPARFERGARPVGSFRHAIVYRRFAVRVFSSVVPAREMQRWVRRRCGHGVECRLFEPSELAEIGRSSLLTKALNLL